MPTPLLPTLRDDGNNQVSVFANPGEWDRRSSVALAQVAKSLRLENVDGEETQIASIPSMWARPLLFEMALFDREHLLHDRIVGEWRGLLALLALRLTKGIQDVDVVPVTIPADATLEGVRALRGTTPTHTTIAAHTDWESLYVITREKIALGMTSPTTLVCTAEEYAAPVRPRLRGRDVEWCLGDPCPTLNRTERTQLLSWLDVVRAQLIADHAIDHNAARWNDLLRALEDFSDDLRRPRGAADAVVEPDPHQRWHTGLLDMTVGMYRHLDRCTALPEEDPLASHVRLMPSEGRDPAMPLLLVSQNLAAQWELNPEDIHVISGTHLGMHTAPNLLTETEFAGVQLGQCRVMDAEALLSESITVLLSRGGLPGVQGSSGHDQVTSQRQEVTPLLPVTSQLLTYWTASDLAQRITFRNQGHSIVVSLRLTLAGPDGRGKDFRVTKRYNTGDRHLVTEPPVLEVWPNFETAAGTWQRYYSFFQREVNSATETFYARPYGAATTADRHVEREKGPGNGEIIAEILSLSAFPEAMECSLSIPNAVGDGTDTIDAGLLVLQRPRRIPPTAGQMSIGVDFGTSGTNVYSRLGQNVPTPMELKNLLHPVTNATARATVLYDYFVSNVNERVPLQSVFMDQVNDDNVPALIRPLVDGHIVYNPNLSNVKDNGRVHTNLKWGGEQERTKTRGFLAELTLQAAAMAASQGIREVSWRFAYPTQFSVAERIAFENIWRDLCDETAEATGVQIADGGPRQHTESVASARFLANHPDITNAAPFSRGVVCLDIGGGTSDLSVWQGTADDGMRFQTSLKYAGRDIFCEQLVQQDEVLPAFDKSYEPFGDGTQQTSKHSAIENVLRHDHDELMKLLNTKVGVNPAVSAFLQTVGLGVVGLFYYVGLVLRSLANEQRYSPQLPDIYVVGNGAKILHWLAFGEYRAGSPIGEVCKQAVRDASGFQEPERFRIHVSPLPKSEVAYGLVSDELRFDADLAEQDKAPVAGENYQMADNVPREWHERVTADDLSQGVTVPTLTYFTRCLEFYQQHAEDAALKPFVMDRDALSQTKEQIDVQLGNEVGRNTQEIGVNPPFIMALRHYLQVHPWRQDTGGV